MTTSDDVTNLDEELEPPAMAATTTTFRSEGARRIIPGDGRLDDEDADDDVLPMINCV